MVTKFIIQTKIYIQLPLRGVYSPHPKTLASSRLFPFRSPFLASGVSHHRRKRNPLICLCFLLGNSILRGSRFLSQIGFSDLLRRGSSLPMAPLVCHGSKSASPLPLLDAGGRCFWVELGVGFCSVSFDELLRRQLAVRFIC